MKFRHKAAAFVAAALIAVTLPALFLPSAAAEWVVPLVDIVGFEYTGGADCTVNFNVNTAESGYATIEVPPVKLTKEQAESYVLPDETQAYDGDTDMRYFFGGWQTEPAGGKLISDGAALAELFEGSDEITLYARWLNKAELTVTLNDMSISSFGIQFELSTSGDALNVATVGSAVAERVVYLAPDDWKISVAARTSSVVITPEQSPVEEGARYTYSAFINRIGTVNLPSVLTKSA